MIIVAAASRAEGMWIPRLPGLRRVSTGMGERAGEMLVRALDAGERPSLVVGTGFCGGLSSDIAAGTIIIGSEIEVEGERMIVDQSLVASAQHAMSEAQLPFRVGRILTTKAVVRSPQGKEELSRGGAIAVDMESAALYRAARASETPFLPLRVVLDERDRELPFAGDHLDALRAIIHPISTLRLLAALIAAGSAIGRAITAIATEPAARSEECVA